MPPAAPGASFAPFPPTGVSLRTVIAIALLLGAVGPRWAPLFAQTATHPLDHLSAAEHWTLYRVLRTSGEIGDEARVLFAHLHERPKAEVLAWEAGEPFRREALVHGVEEGTGYEAVVDLQAEELPSFEAVSETSYMLGPDDWCAGSGITEHPEIRAALEARGYTDFTMVRVLEVIDSGPVPHAVPPPSITPRPSAPRGHPSRPSW